MEKVVIQNPASADNDGIIRISRKSDFPLELQIANAKGEKEPFPEDCDFTATFSTGGFAKYEVSRKGETFNHCRITQDKTLLVFFDNHGLGCGRISVELTLLHPDPDYGTDGIRQETITSQTSIELSTQTAAEVSLELPKPIVEIKEVEKIVEKPVEKIVEKVVEKPVEVVKEVVREVPKAMTQEEKDKMFIADYLTQWDEWNRTSFAEQNAAKCDDPIKVIKVLLEKVFVSPKVILDKMSAGALPNSKDGIFVGKELAKGICQTNPICCDHMFETVGNIDGKKQDIEIDMNAPAYFRMAFMSSQFNSVTINVGTNWTDFIIREATENYMSLDLKSEKLRDYIKDLRIFDYSNDCNFIVRNLNLEPNPYAPNEPIIPMSLFLLPAIGFESHGTWDFDLGCGKDGFYCAYTADEIISFVRDLNKIKPGELPPQLNPKITFRNVDHIDGFAEKAKEKLSRIYERVTII